ncbi:pyrroloquinoline quinone biosynthesis protein PqqB [Methylobacterium indicum]|uniref:pyrroloquinoline quinone biosynthesis protein PqqB n=1 Tax=Methylobacterium indicum TaxID=1775910 RepID=UPI000734633D|nr:pyrroloquinoline quinone biosynthesis protein PqqB [Methylobacterium indicum]KTS37723.1 pyrroloquinoline quinone biosynthesis protein PqqB [Methylobacterium indicum]KTS39084.1 pyrroloquinoline quinone biosynthesis protein PqqB [Methylobacterium indicum]KTS51766.1 pyrroloquinoline quinone biosynthesis protein PqqB [Methylobacterium indicum]
MQAIVLGSGAGGGVPQWNCRCPICAMARSGDRRVLPRTQSSLAVSADGDDWLLVNASPDIRQQLFDTPALHPREGLRHSPIKAVLLTNGDVDHVAGLLTLREGQPFRLHATRGILDSIAANRVFDVMAPGVVDRTEIALNETFSPVPGLSVTLFPVPGKVPLWLEDGTPEIGAETESTVGAMIVAGARRLAYVPGCARVTDGLKDRLSGVDALLFDGTVLADDDMIRAGVGTKTGWRMGHVPMTGDGGSVAALAEVPIGQKVFVHINNTNPVLVEDSPERRGIEAAGWVVAHDGLALSL